MTEPATPLMQQYHAVKKQHPAALLLFRLGDFYELFYDDAVIASKILQITLTSRNKEKDSQVPMCGVPYHAAESYIARLIRAGHRVAICEQMEEPGPGKKIVRREVIRVLTPGTSTASALVEEKENNFLAAIVRGATAAQSGRVKAQRMAASQGAASTQALLESEGAGGVPSGLAIGLAYVDLSTGEFRATEFAGEKAEFRLRDELSVLRPRELLLPKPRTLFPASAPPGKNGFGALETPLDDWIFEANHAARLLEEQFRVAVLDGFGLTSHPLATSAAGAIVHYLRETSSIGAGKESSNGAGPSLRPSGAGLEHLDRIAYYQQQDAMALDAVTVRNLELIEPSAGDDPSATLVSALDETATGMGARLLRRWIIRPEISLSEIEARLNAVADLKSRTVVREELFAALGRILDLERLTSRVTLGTAAPRDLLALKSSLEKVPHLRGLLCVPGATATPEVPAAPTPSPAASPSPRLENLAHEMDDLADVHSLIARSIADDPPVLASDPGVIRQGFDAELDGLRDVTRHGRQIIAGMEDRERKRTGIASLKIRYNQVFGYYIEITKPNLPLVPPDYERKQTLVNAERFTSAELKEHERKILTAEERVIEIERRLYAEIRESIASQAARLRRTAAAIAQLDVLVNFARIAAARRYTRPEFTESSLGVAAAAQPLANPGSALPRTARFGTVEAKRGILMISSGRHPVIERLLEERGERFVPNDLWLDDESQSILIITGPNMGGKSTYLRQAALISVMAQMGSFVPAAQARLPLVDRVFTRIGASDNLARGRSTFLVEMSEVAGILNAATPASLVLLDEVGRGTATFDGLSIAWAVVEALHAGGRPRTLFATHYHELTELEQLLPGVRNVHVSVQEAGSEIVFLRRVEPGSADKSYGIEVARLAGLPQTVIARAREILRRHEQSEEKLTEQLSPGSVAPTPHQTSFAEVGPVRGAVENAPARAAMEDAPVSAESENAPVKAAANNAASVLDALRSATVDELTPREALNLLANLQNQLK